MGEGRALFKVVLINMDGSGVKSWFITVTFKNNLSILHICTAAQNIRTERSKQVPVQSKSAYIVKNCREKSLPLCLICAM